MCGSVYECLCYTITIYSFMHFMCVCMCAGVVYIQYSYIYIYRIFVRVHIMHVVSDSINDWFDRGSYHTHAYYTIDTLNLQLLALLVTCNDEW